MPSETSLSTFYLFAVFSSLALKYIKVQQITEHSISESRAWNGPIKLQNKVPLSGCGADGGTCGNTFPSLPATVILRAGEEILHLGW